MANTKVQSTNIADMIEALRARRLSRRKFVAGLTALGVTGVGAATIAISVQRRQAGTHAAGKPATHDPILQHHQHLTSQVQGDVGSHMADYAEHAMVDDPLFSAPFSGKAAIAARFAAEIASVPDRAITVLKRTAVGAQLIVEWEARGTHSAPFFGIGGLGRPYVLRGTTLVTREQGKIVRESHFYDAAALRRQIDA